MSKGRETSFSKAFTATATSSGEESIATIPQGPEFHVKRVDINIAGGAGIDVSVSVGVGARSIAPEQGAVAGGGQRFELKADASLGPSTEITASWDNASSTDREIIVVVNGAYMDSGSEL